MLKPSKVVISSKKLAANRSNAKKSTGPKSIRGKEKSRDNAKKHGAYATRTVLFGEDKDLYEAIRKEQRAIFQPHTFIQKALVDQLVSELWTLKRVARAELLQLEEIRRELRSDDLENRKNLTVDELELMQMMKDSPDKLEEILGQERKNPKEGGLGDRLLKAFSSLSKGPEAISTDRIYEYVFLNSSNDQLQRLAAFKRRVMKEILTLERELKKTLRERSRGQPV